MDLELYFTFSVDELKAQMQAGKYSNLRTFEYGYMNGGIQADAPQYVSTWYSNSWNKVSASSLAPSGPPGGYAAHSEWARFSATCMYFGAELIDAKRKMLGKEESEVPIGLIQSAVGGTQIESWISNATRAKCSQLDPKGGSGGLSGLYHAMVAPFLNYSVAGWLWYQVILAGMQRCLCCCLRSSLLLPSGCRVRMLAMLAMLAQKLGQLQPFVAVL
jgi:hypothetical protein